MSNFDAMIEEWQSKNRRMGCVSAAEFVSKRMEGFYPKRLTRFTADGDYWEHVIATNGKMIIDLVPQFDRPE